VKDPAQFVPPMLAETAPAPFDDPEWRFEPKWDGWRAVVSFTDEIRVWSRSGRNLGDRLTGLESLGACLRAPVVVDGELIAVDAGGQPRFQALAHRAARWVYVVFDCLYDGRWLLEDALDARIRRLEGVVRPGSRLILNEGVDGHGSRLFKALAAKGWEGVMAKRRTSPYRPGRRSADWLKLLAWRERQARAVEWSARASTVSVTVALPEGRLWTLPWPKELPWDGRDVGRMVRIRVRGGPGDPGRHARVIGWVEDRDS
jgi:ATP-dependent DNA ligase